jgi:hypothetical protein
MTTFDPPRAGAIWQLPWLRLSLILRRMAASDECGPEDLSEMLAMRREIARSGWFN